MKITEQMLEDLKADVEGHLDVDVKSILSTGGMVSLIVESIENWDLEITSGVRLALQEILNRAETLFDIEWEVVTLFIGIDPFADEVLIVLNPIHPSPHDENDPPVTHPN